MKTSYSKEHTKAHYTLLHNFWAVRQKVQGCMKARHGCQSKVVLPLAAKRVERSKVNTLKNKSRNIETRSNLQREEISSFEEAASFKNCQSRSDTVLECDPASYWKRTVALTALQGTAETRCKCRQQNMNVIPPKLIISIASSLILSASTNSKKPKWLQTIWSHVHNTTFQCQW